jgi:uncharacterized protein
MRHVIRILSIDGGGIRGIIPTHILHCMVSRQGIDLGKEIDMIAGTSTGAITAAAIACGFLPEKIELLYSEHVAAIFTPRTTVMPTKFMQSCVNSIYKTELLEEVLKEYFGDRRLGDVKMPLLLPVTNIGSGEVHVFKSDYTKDHNSDLDVKISSAVLASCASPIFFSPRLVGVSLIADGGLWAYNPALLAVLEAGYQLGANMDDVRVLSMGTGRSQSYYSFDAKRRWGVVTGWEGGKLIEMLVALHANSTLYYLRQLLRPEQLLRVDFDTDHETELDDCSAVSDLLHQADTQFNHFSPALNTFFNND